MRGSAVRFVAAGVLAASLLLVVGSVAPAAAGSPPAAQQLRGTFRLERASCTRGHPSGSYVTVTYGTRSIANPQSGCDRGVYTLLQPGRRGLSTERFSPLDDLTFDGGGDPHGGGIARTVGFRGHRLSLVTSPRDLQAAPTGPAVFAPPTIYLIGHRLVGDVRSVQALYDGRPGSSCVTAAGAGCWLVGAERATGSFNPTTRRFSLQWFSGQSFVGSSAGTVVHLAGRFYGVGRPVPQGRTVDLGTQSFAAGSPPPRSAVVTSGKPRRHRAAPRHRRTAGPATAAGRDDTAGRPGWPESAAEVLLALNGVASVGVLARRRRTR
ncbi:MAG TPA: hypothetical protein VG708_12990 [Mycobacteriales bacterium]|nr:hypothetical protein [Mycobacteriales bacterium]